MDDRRTSPVGPAAVAEAVASLRAGWLAVLAVGVLGLIGGFLFATRTESTERQSERIELKAVGDNRTLVDLGISAPASVSPGDFTREELLDRVAFRLGIEPDDLEGRFHVIGVPAAASLIDLQVDTDGDPDQALKYLRVWADEIQTDRRKSIAQLIEDAKVALSEDTEVLNTAKARAARNATLAKMEALQGTLKTDVEPNKKAEIVVTPSKSKPKYTVAGGLVGLVLGGLLVLLFALTKGVARTPAGMASRFGAPVVADLTDEDGKRQLDAWLASVERPVIVDASGSTEAATTVRADHPEVPVAGSVGKTAPALPADAASCLVLARLGTTGLSESDQLRLILAQAPQVKRLGIVLV